MATLSSNHEAARPSLFAASPTAFSPIKLEQDRAATVDSDFTEHLPVKQILAHNPEGLLNRSPIKRLSLTHKRNPYRKSGWKSVNDPVSLPAATMLAPIGTEPPSLLR
jgi:hypothetical protein